MTIYRIQCAAIIIHYNVQCTMISVHSTPESIGDCEPLVLGAEVVGPDGGVCHGGVPLPGGGGSSLLGVHCTVYILYIVCGA